MGVRKRRACNENKCVHRIVGKYNVTIEPDTYVNKSRAYSKFNGIKNGTKLPLPLSKIGKRNLWYKLYSDGKMELLFAVNFQKKNSSTGG